jgi:aldehyde dehydrogenase (NAD+)
LVAKLKSYVNPSERRDHYVVERAGAFDFLWSGRRATGPGCTILAKPAPETRLEAQIIAECAEAVGLSPGVLNVVPAGHDVGDYLINRSEVDKVSFIGSVAGGKRIAEVCAKPLAR